MPKTYILHAKVKKKHIIKYWENLFNIKVMIYNMKLHDLMS